MSFVSPATGDLPLAFPAYGIGFVPAIKRAFAKFVVFSGRASRSEYWWFALFNFLGLMVFFGLGLGLGLGTSPDGGNTPGAAGVVFLVLGGLFYLAVLLPGIALGVRRLHDANFSGWMLLLGLIPSVGGVAILVLTVLPSNPAGVRFDEGAAGGAAPPDPYAAQGYGASYPPAPYGANPYEANPYEAAPYGTSPQPPVPYAASYPPAGYGAEPPPAVPYSAPPASQPSASEPPQGYQPPPAPPA